MNQHAFILAALSIGGLFSTVQADVTPASPFTDHMVLQQGKQVPVWGIAAAGEKVAVSLNGQTQNAVADADGKWMVRLNDLQYGGPFDLSISGNNSIKLSDVYVGEVWFCSGQSNMDFTVARTDKYYFAGVKNEMEEIAAANYPTIRMFKGDWQKTYKPAEKATGEWKVCTPENVREFSAVGYFFARDLQKELNVPVGIIAQTFGASTCEAWIRRETIQSIPEMTDTLAKFDDKVSKFTDEDRKKYVAARAEFDAMKAKNTAEGKPTTGRAPGNPDPVQDQHQPTVMYNGMIAPMIPYGIKGFLWYQGESVIGGPVLYSKLQTALVNDWRKLWGDESLPFYNVQLAAQDARSNNPDVRAAQATILDLPNTGMAVTVDIGEKKNVHPKNKQDVGYRLSLIALAKAYGKPVEYAGPTFQSMNIEGGTVRINFTHANSGLVAKDSESGELKTFEVAGGDGKYVAATAKIDNGSVVVSSPEVAEPKSVRYAWSQWPEGCNLYNKDNLPAAPFKTP